MHNEQPDPAAPKPIASGISTTPESFWERFVFYMNPIDGRYEDLKGNWKINVFRDFTAGLIVAMVAIPMAMGFAMASGLPPAMGSRTSLLLMQPLPTLAGRWA